MYEENLYYTPEKLGYEIVTVFELRDEPWEFDLLIVWRDPDGNLKWAADTGCSCPVPFEDHTPGDLYDYDYNYIANYIRGTVGSEGPLAMQAEDKLAELRKL